MCYPIKELSSIVPQEVVVYVNSVIRNAIARRNQEVRAQIFITDKCENSCYYCYVDRSRMREMTYEGFIKIIKNFQAYSLQLGIPLFVNLIGGNPLLNPFIFDYLNYLNQNQIEFYLTCNPSPLTRKTAKKLRSYSMLKGVQFTALSDEKTHKKVRGVDDFNAMIFYTLYLTRIGIPVTWRYNIAKDSLGRIDSMFELIRNVKPTLVDVNRLCNIGNAIGVLDSMSAKECRCILDSIFKNFCNSFNKGIRFGFKEHLWFPYLVEEGVIDFASFENLPDAENRCRAFYERYVIDVDGTVLVCRRLPKLSLGNCLNEEMTEIALNGNKKSFVNVKSYVKCSHCKYNRWCMGCPAVSESFGDSIFGSDPHCWVEASDAD